MITVTESRLFTPSKTKPKMSVLYIRRDVAANGSYREYSYTGPTDEVVALAERACDVDMEKVDELLREGKTFDEALTALGK